MELHTVYRLKPKLDDDGPFIRVEPVSTHPTKSAAHSTLDHLRTEQLDKDDISWQYLSLPADLFGDAYTLKLFPLLE